MAKYIVYCLNEAGNIWRSEWIEADSDKQAVAKATAQSFPHGCEVWDRDRFVGRVGGRAD